MVQYGEWNIYKLKLIHAYTTLYQTSPRKQEQKQAKQKSIGNNRDENSAGNGRNQTIMFTLDEVNDWVRTNHQWEEEALEDHAKGQIYHRIRKPAERAKTKKQAKCLNTIIKKKKKKSRFITELQKRKKLILVKK